jgi:hypothetical protein
VTVSRKLPRLHYMTVLKLSFISLDLVEKLVSLEYDAELKRQLKIEYACL